MPQLSLLQMINLHITVQLLLEAKRCFMKQKRELVLYERMKYIVRTKSFTNII